MCYKGNNILLIQMNNKILNKILKYRVNKSNERDKSNTPTKRKQRDNLMFQAFVKPFLWKQEVKACSINNANDKLFNNARALTIRVIR